MVVHLVLAVLCSAVYAPCTEKGNTFVFDDVVAVQENKDVTRRETDLHAIFAHDFWGSDITKSDSHKSYRPLAVLYLRAIFQTYGVDATDGATNAVLLPPFYKTGNVILNTFLCSLVYEVAFKLALSASTPQAASVTGFITALLYTIHPVRSEAVASIVGCADLLSAIFALISVLIVLQGKHSVRSIAAMLCIATAVLCKETGLGVAVSVAVLALFRAEKGQVFIIMVFASGVASLLYARSWVTGFDPVVTGFRKLDNPIPYLKDPNQRGLAVVRVWVEYVRLMVCPLYLSADYSMAAVPLPEVNMTNKILLFGVFPISVAAITLVLAKLAQLTWQQFAFLALFFGGTIAPALHLFFYPGTVVAERLTTLPVFALCFVFACIASRGLKRFFFTTVLVLLCTTIVGAGLTHKRSREWKNLNSLFESAAKNTPGSAKTQLNVGIARFNEKNVTEAEAHLRKAEEIFPEGCQVDYWIGRCHMERQEWNHAVSRMQKAVTCKERDHSRHALVALEKIFKEYAKHDPKDPDKHTNLANIFALQRRNKDAANIYKHAIKLAKAKGKEHAAGPAHLNYARLLKSEGNLKEALTHATYAEVKGAGTGVQEAHILAEELRAALGK